MHRAQRIERASSTKLPQIIDNRQPKPAPADESAGPPIRTVFFMEVGDMERVQIELLIQEVNKAWNGNGGTHFVIPVRHGRIRSDIIFEKEFIDVVNKMCEIKDGQIVLRGGTQDVVVVRQMI